MTQRRLPPNASVATAGNDGKMVAPAASRNVDVLSDLIERIAPKEGRALEIASGTGQHIAAFAQRCPGLQWHPTEIAEDRRTSIDAYAANLPNVSKAVFLDATEPGWHTSFGGLDLVILVNLLHLIDMPQAETLIAEASLALRPAGRLMLYGPFMRAGQLTSDGDLRFHTALTEQDPGIGYKDDGQIRSQLQSNDLILVEQAEMPANNLAFVAQKPGL